MSDDTRESAELVPDVEGDGVSQAHYTKRYNLTILYHLMHSRLSFMDCMYIHPSISFLSMPTRCSWEWVNFENAALPGFM
jgi:hypothetical protein